MTPNADATLATASTKKVISVWMSVIALAYPPPCVQLAPILVLLFVHQQHRFLPAKIAQPYGGGAGLRAIKHPAVLGNRLCGLWRSRFNPDRIGAGSGLAFRLKQLLFVIDHVFWIE